MKIFSVLCWCESFYIINFSCVYCSSLRPPPNPPPLRFSFFFPKKTTSFMLAFISYHRPFISASPSCFPSPRYTPLLCTYRPSARLADTPLHCQPAHAQLSVVRNCSRISLLVCSPWGTAGGQWVVRTNGHTHLYIQLSS
jgi:hypothetical protein